MRGRAGKSFAGHEPSLALEKEPRMSRMCPAIAGEIVKSTVHLASSLFLPPCLSVYRRSVWNFNLFL